MVALEPRTPDFAALSVMPRHSPPKNLSVSHSREREVQRKYLNRAQLFTDVTSEQVAEKDKSGHLRIDSFRRQIMIDYCKHI